MINSLLWQDVEVKPKPARKIKKVSISSNSDEGLGDLSFGPSSSLLPDIPPALARPTHNLKQVSRIFFIVWILADPRFFLHSAVFLGLDSVVFPSGPEPDLGGEPAGGGHGDDRGGVLAAPPAPAARLADGLGL